MGVLRIGYKGRETKFEYSCDKKQVKETLHTHLNAWKQDANGPIPVADVVAEYAEVGGEFEAVEVR